MRTVLRSLPKSFQAKVTAIKESKDLEETKIQEIVDSLQTYELGLPSHKASKSLALKTLNERTSDSSDEDNVEKGVVFLAKNFLKFLKIKNNGKSFGKGRFSSSKNDKREYKKKDEKELSSTQGIVCYECNWHGNLKKECPNYLRGKRKVFATTLNDSKSSNSCAEGESDNDGNYSGFMAITAVDTRDELSELVDDLGVHSKGEEVDVLDDEDVYLNKGEKNFQEVYNALLEDCGKYAKVAKSAIKKMKKIEEEHKSTLVQLKEVKCEVEEVKEELLNAYSKIKFVELEIIQANVKVERISTKKLDNVLSYQKTFI